ELALALARQRIHLRGASELGVLPLRRDPSLILETVQRGIERSLAHREHVVREQLDALRDRPSVQRLTRERLQDQEIERALQKVGWFRHQKGLDEDTSIIDNAIPRTSTTRSTTNEVPA